MSLQMWFLTWKIQHTVQSTAGFRSKRSCQTHLVKTSYGITTDLVLLDVSIVFDRVRIPAKVAPLWNEKSNLGMDTGVPPRWTQTVVLGNEKSGTVPVSSGVP